MEERIKTCAAKDKHIYFFILQTNFIKQANKHLKIAKLFSFSSCAILCFKVTNGDHSMTRHLSVYACNMKKINTLGFALPAFAQLLTQLRQTVYHQGMSVVWVLANDGPECWETHQD